MRINIQSFDILKDKYLIFKFKGVKYPNWDVLRGMPILPKNMIYNLRRNYLWITYMSIQNKKNI
jgi:hypothetical protein